MLKTYIILFQVLSLVLTQGGVDVMKMLAPYLEGDDMVTMEELIQACMEYFDLPNEEEGRRSAEYGMELLDTNNDGVISRNEVIDYHINNAGHKRRFTGWLVA